jgi:hypothetical protein
MPIGRGLIETVAQGNELIVEEATESDLVLLLRARCVEHHHRVG